MAETLAKNPSPMNFHSALNVVRDIVKANPDAILVNEGANALDFTRSIVDMYKPRKRLDVGTWGIMGIGMGFAVAAAVVTGKQVIAIEGDSAFGFSGMEVETICRYNLPVCVVVMNNNGVYKGTDVNPTGGADPAPTGVRQGRALREADGGLRRRRRARRRRRTSCARRMEEAVRSRQADADQRGDRRDGRHRERPHHEPESERGEEEVMPTARDEIRIDQGERRMSKALDGVRILDFTHVQSGPTCTQLLAWFGADVIKVEQAGEGDATRGQLRDIPNVDSLYFTMLNHNKRSITRQHEEPEGQGGARSTLIKQCDVLVENFAPGALDRMGFTWEHIQELNPRMIVASVKGFGPGPYEDCKVYENVAQCAGGAASHDRLRRRPAARHRRADRRLAAPACTSRSASSPRCTSATRPAAARRCWPRCRTAC